MSARRLASLGFYTVLITLALQYVDRLDWTVLSSLDIDLLSIAIATALGLSFRACGLVIWLQILRGLGASGRLYGPDALFVYAKSWLGRYLPGKVTWVLGRIYFASEHGISKRTLAVSALCEAGLQTTVTLCLALVLLAADARLDLFSRTQKTTLLLIGLVLGTTMLPKVFNAVVGTVARVARPDTPFTERVDSRTMARGVALYAVGFFLSGASYFFLTRAIYPGLTATHFLFVSGVFNLAGAVGILAIFTPSGLGVREGIQVLLLPLIMPLESAVAVTLLARVWSIAVDVVFFGIAWASRAAASHERPLPMGPSSRYGI